MKGNIDFYKKVFNEIIPFNKYIGLELVHIEAGFAKATIQFKQELVGDIRIQAIHGGVISAAMDAVGGVAGMTTLTSVEDKIVTVDMRVDYIRSARNTDLRIEANIVRSGNKIITTNMQVFAVNDNILVAEGRGVYHVSRKVKE
ncbi:MAG: hotdog fold thioesterase [Chitinophagales bacterium]|nr:hotdog fold thioesterase [Chitinophagales bacterium]HMV14231.1 hotdog fold thioesterase [Chitinophagales bacterium]HMW11668.1 hotdog fold thioesterase [Chitinophagales bacterium]HMX59188.1 hotdog fold thioesterase [Chitinophagales bacterium]HMY23980.1 hotdog fold thioesterase [Chitinophagales bacterium]